MESGQISKATVFKSTLNLELSEDPTQEEIESKILSKYEEKLVKATYYESNYNKQLVLESLRIITDAK